MTKRTKAALLVSVIAAIGAASFYVYQHEDSFKVEFGESAETREAFGALLTKQNIRYQIESDHLGRVWVVPDQTKRKEYEAALRIWEQARKEEVRKENEARRL